MLFTGQVLHAKGDDVWFEEEYIVVEDGVIVEIGTGLEKSADYEGIIVPLFVNMHTHIADCAIGKRPPRRLKDAVAPPKGFKHVMLKKLGRDRIVMGIKSGLIGAFQSATIEVWDFREEGLDGILFMREATSTLKIPVRAKVLARPNGHTLDEIKNDEIYALLHMADGFGISSILDYDYDLLQTIADIVRIKKKILAVHMAEGEREDVGKVLDLKPRFVIHAIHATKEDMQSLRDEGVGVVICPRANSYFGMMPNVGAMIDVGLDVALGTDNCMLARPSLLEEMQYLYRVSSLYNWGLEFEDIIRVAFINSGKILNPRKYTGVARSARAEFAVLRGDFEDPAYYLVMRAAASDICAICVGKHLWRFDEKWKNLREY